MKTFSLATASTMLCASAGWAGFWDATELLQRCQTNRTDAVAYVVGIHDMMELLTETNVGGRLACLPHRITATELTNTVCQYVTENPKVDRRNAGSKVLEALVQAYPCTN